VAECGTVVCDLGGVVLRWDPLALVREALALAAPESLPPESMPPGFLPPGFLPGAATAEALAPLLFQDFTPDSDWSAFDRGVLDLDALVVRITDRTRLGPDLVRAVLDAIPAHLQFVPGTVALLGRLREAGHRVVYLSNMPTPFADRLDADPRFGSWFDGGVFSCRVRSVKPEPRIYQVAEQRLRLDDRHRVLMIDDRPVNLVQARARGWSGLTFRDPDDCAAQLRAAAWL
jgi:putative hydrolase of the HAD superfamily